MGVPLEPVFLSLEKIGISLLGPQKAHSLLGPVPIVTQKQSLQQPLHSYCCPVNQRWDAWHHSDTRALCGKSSWGSSSNPQEGCPGLTDRNRGT